MRTDEAFQKAVFESKVRQEEAVTAAYSKGKNQVTIRPNSVFGLANMGNTCFFNSAMQCLNSCRPFVEQYIDNIERFSKHDGILQREFWALSL